MGKEKDRTVPNRENGTTTISRYLVMNHSVSPASWLMDLFDPNHEYVGRNLLYIFSFDTATSTDDIHGVSLIPWEEGSIRHGTVYERSSYIGSDPTNEAYFTRDAVIVYSLNRYWIPNIHTANAVVSFNVSDTTQTPRIKNL